MSADDNPTSENPHDRIPPQMDGRLRRGTMLETRFTLQETVILTAGSPSRLLFPIFLKLPLQKPDESCFELGTWPCPPLGARADYACTFRVAGCSQEWGIGADEVWT